MNRFYSWLPLILFAAPSIASEHKQPITFTATPEQCVALHKGQVCYQDVLFQWQTPASGRFCLMLSQDQQPLTCWEGKALQQYKYSFESDSTTIFSLVSQDDLNAVAKVKVVVTWVYKAPKQSPSGWRLF